MPLPRQSRPVVLPLDLPAAGVFRSARQVSGMTAYFYRTSAGAESDLRPVWPRTLDAEVIADLADELRTAEMELTFTAALFPPLRLLR